MTTVGHTLTALSLAAVSVPPAKSARWKSAWIFVLCLLSNLPDLPLPGWGHARYHVSHSSVLALGVATILSAWALRRGVPRGWATRGVVLAAVAAWLSHMLLDSLYNHGLGLAVLWPLSDAHLALPLPWFATLRPPARSVHNLRVFAVELVFYGLLFALCVAGRRFHARGAAR